MKLQNGKVSVQVLKEGKECKDCKDYKCEIAYLKIIHRIQFPDKTYYDQDILTYGKKADGGEK
jgi:hypothetical protein